MSRTDKDVPYRVFIERYGVPDHDHRDGKCDEPHYIDFRFTHWGMANYTACSLEAPRGRNWYPTPKDARKIDQHKRRQADRQALYRAKYDPDNWDDTVPINHRHGTYGGGWWT